MESKNTDEIYYEIDSGSEYGKMYLNVKIIPVYLETILIIQIIMVIGLYYQALICLGL